MATVPWFWDAQREDAMLWLEENKPRVALFSDKYTVWSYKITDYAPELCQYIEENYTQFSESFSHLYVRNNYYQEAQEILVQMENASWLASKPLETTCGFITEEPVVQTFVAQGPEITTFSIRFATYGEKYEGRINISIKETQSQNEIWQTEIKGTTVKDNAWYPVLLRCDESIPVNERTEYQIEISATDPTGENNLTIWAKKNQGQTDKNGLFIDGILQKYELNMVLR